MKRLAAYYSFVITTLLVITGIISATTLAQLVSAAIFIPLAVYFTLLVLPRKKRVEAKTVVETPEPEITPAEEGTPAFDFDRRMFLKLIGSAGLSVFFFALFTKRAEAAFFGSVPGPGTVALKDSSGTKIDPAEKQPTDGYRISELDDAATPGYYGFTDKTGAWFIMKEDSSGAYRYVKGSSAFSTNWTNRASLSYDYYHNVF